MPLLPQEHYQPRGARDARWAARGPIPKNRNMSDTQYAGLVALQVLEAIRTSHPELIADSMPAGWGLNRLRRCLQPQANQAGQRAEESADVSRVTKTVLQFTVLHDDAGDLSSYSLENIAHLRDVRGYVGGCLTVVSSTVLTTAELNAEAAALGSDAAFFDLGDSDAREGCSTPAAQCEGVVRAFEAPFFVFIDHEQSVSDHPTMELARLAGQVACDAEVLPCSFSIQDAHGNHVEDIVRSDGASIGDLVKTFNASQGPR